MPSEVIALNSVKSLGLRCFHKLRESVHSAKESCCQMPCGFRIPKKQSESFYQPQTSPSGTLRIRIHLAFNNHYSTKVFTVKTRGMLTFFLLSPLSQYHFQQASSYCFKYRCSTVQEPTGFWRDHSIP